MAGYKYSGLSPDETTNYKSGTLGSGGGYDYSKLINQYLGGGGGGRSSGGGGGLGYSSGGVAGLGRSIIRNTQMGMPSAGYGAMGGIAVDAANAAYLQREQLPYMTELQVAQMNNQSAMQQARLNAGVSLAQARMQADLQRQIEMQRIADNEKNRQHQLEQQRRSAQQSDYEQKQQYYYEYGL